MNEQDLAKPIVQHLNQDLGRIKQGSLYQLQSARLAALEHYREVPQQSFAPAWAGDLAFRVTHSPHFNLRNLVAAGMLVIGMMGVTYWQVVIKSNDIAEIDANLMSGELPISAYLDSGFEAWLKRSPQ